MKTKTIRRALFSAFMALLVSAVVLVELDNNQLAQAVIAKQKHDAEIPKEEPVVPEPTPTPSQIQAITDKLSADGCNFNAETATKRVALGNCKILLIGDSLGNNLAYGMIPQLANATTLTFTGKAKASTGLSNAWFYNWHTNLATFLKTYKPNLVVVFLGANDRQNYVVNGVTQTFGTEAWKKTYRSNITKIAKAATASGSYVLWVGMPIMKPYNYAKGITLIDEQFALAVPKVPGATYLPTRAYFADAAGNYRRDAYVNGKLTQIRGEDGIHFSYAGQGVIATYVINAIVRTYHVDMPPKGARYITK